MATLYEIPVIDAPRQTLETVLADTPVTIALNWNAWLGRWALDFALNGVGIFAGVRMVPDVDFLKPYGPGIGKLALVEWQGSGGNPGRTELPAGTFRLIFLPA